MQELISKLKTALIEEIEFEIILCRKTGKVEFIAGLERAIDIISEN